MPYLKCSPCKVRVAVAGPEAEAFPPSCPECCGALEPAHQLSELIGFRRCEPDADTARPPASGGAMSVLAGAVAGADPRWESAIAQALPDPTSGMRHGPKHHSGPTRESTF
jgi:hypothetical protein